MQFPDFSRESSVGPPPQVPVLLWSRPRIPEYDTYQALKQPPPSPPFPSPPSPSLSDFELVEKVEATCCSIPDPSVKDGLEECLQVYNTSTKSTSSKLNRTFMCPSPTGDNSLRADRTRKRKGLVIGTTHPDRHFRLTCCTEDAYSMAHFICTELGFARDEVLVMTDETESSCDLPTKDNILAAMRELVADAQPGDSFFFYFSGDGMQIKDLDRDDLDEPDGQDECICATDYRGNDPNTNENTPGLIVDHSIHDILVQPLPRGCRLTAVFDMNLIKQHDIAYEHTDDVSLQSCHSGTALVCELDDSHGLVKYSIPQDRLWLLRPKASDADVVFLSASTDNQKARETRLGGALRCAFIDCVGATGHTLTYRELLHQVREYMRRHGFPQRLLLWTSYEIDTNMPFIT